MVSNGNTMRKSDTFLVLSVDKIICLKTILYIQISKLYIFFQGLPGVDGREGIPGMPGAKVQPCLSLVNHGNVESVIVVIMEMWFFYRAPPEKLEAPGKLAFKDSL